ncbi:MAG: hypothetical protein U9R25_05240 [Chloroflexota bacterium]|nr:hypothetical protein [Chloroflexota bacterium]
MDEWHYRLFGLGLTSNRPLPGLEDLSKSVQTDLQVFFNAERGKRPAIDALPRQPLHISAEREVDGSPMLAIWELDSTYILLQARHGLAALVDRTGTRVWIWWPDVADQTETAALLLMGPLMRMVLRFRGIPFLHASAVNVGDKALAFVGSSGAGKSTLAAAFAQLGYPIISDDVVALFVHDHVIAVSPGYNRIHLWPEALRLVEGISVDENHLIPGWDKVFLEEGISSLSFESRSLPLAGVFLLTHHDSDREAVEPLAPADALVELLTCAHPSFVLDTTMRLRDFEFFSWLAETIPAWQICFSPEGSDPARLGKEILEQIDPHMSGGQKGLSIV